MNNNRALLVIFVLIIFFAALLIKLFDIQIRKHDDFDYYAKNQQIEKKVIRAERGFIYDRNGELLAYDRNDVSFFVDTRMAKDKDIDSLSSIFSRVFGNSKSYYRNKLKNPASKVVCLEKKAPAELAVKLKDVKINGLFSKEDPTRIYSYDNLASHVLGYVGNSYEGIDGVEKYYNKVLTGTDGNMIIERDVKGRMVTVSEDATVQPVPGENLVLTIDKSYQKILEEELRKGLEQFQSNAAIGIIMDPNTGEILALANMPDYNPNKYGASSDAIRRNRALTDTYEPGSTFKSITISTLFDKHLIKGNESVYAENGKFRYRNVNITDSHKLQWLTVREVIEQSSNIGMAKLIGKIDDDSFYKYLRNYGFGNYSFIDLPGESRGTLKKPGNFNELTQAFMSFGYEVSVTPIQIATAYAALVNGGTLYQPHLLKRVTSRDGSVKEEFTPKPLRNVIRKETSDRIKNLLVGVIENGTAKTAKLDRVTAGGKTGTSQQLINNKYSSSSYNSSFVGFFPADKPKVVCYILVNSPQVGRYGGLVAAPIFKNVAERLIAADINLISGTKLKDDEKTKFEKVITASEKVSQNRKYADVPQNSQARNYSVSRPSVLNKSFMPDLSSYNLRDAVAVLLELGIKYKIEGSGKVVSQSLPSGTRIRPGLFCQLKCVEKKLTGARIN
ncbi:MAG: transpeptidase family protein [Ignavibacteria bacterium]|jgi:cell division protein FtsI/penicillin-binding protein 2|nr:transpeptidase family protein [Ignavibacteria bacterium]MCU7503159.1 transpeptidase family protein [Ignavibacteria bacterium]MCU7518037.1 transpeptidase family protein [Ignavibacteria bacterium]